MLRPERSAPGYAWQASPPQATREFYQEYNAAFARQWKDKTSRLKVF